MGKLVRGLGINSTEKPYIIDSVPIREYRLWSDMLLRCTQKYWDKKPTYSGTTCSDNFKSYSYFYNWYHKQVGATNKDSNGKSWHLDKDLLGNGSKVYSEDTCCFVPSQVNNLFLAKKTDSAKYPRGISREKRVKTDCFVVCCGDGNGSYTRSCGYRTIPQAFSAYKLAKEGVIKMVAEKYKDQLDPKAYQALINYTVEITD